MCPLETQVLCKNIEKVKNKKLFISICYITKKKLYGKYSNNLKNPF